MLVFRGVQGSTSAGSTLLILEGTIRSLKLYPSLCAPILPYVIANLVAGLHTSEFGEFAFGGSFGKAWLAVCGEFVTPKALVAAQ